MNLMTNRTDFSMLSRVVFCCGWLFILSFTVSLHAMDSIITRVQHRIERGIEQTIVTDFSGAKETFRKLIEDYSDQPFGYFYLGATYQAEMLDAEQFNQLNKFSKLMEQCIRISERLRNKNGDDVWLLFYEGSAYLYRGFMDSKQKNFFEAYRNSLKGVHRLEDAIRMDSTFYDAYLGVGSFKYWKSSKAKALTWLPFISDERKLGIEMVKTAIKKGKLVNLVGRDQLAWILLDYEKMDQALELAWQNYQIYPQSRFFLWTLVEIYYRSGKWDKAYPLYEKLLSLCRQDPESNHYNEIGCLVRMAEIRYEKGDYTAASSLADEVIRLDINEEVRQHTRSKREKAQQIKKESLQELTELRRLTH